MENIVQGQWFRGPSADLGEPINQSLRFTSSGYLKRAQSSSGDGLISSNRTWTFSTWFKHGDMGETQIFGIHQASSDNWLVAWTSGASYDTFLSRDYTGWQQYDSTQKFRDPNAWYHIFLTCSSGVMTMKVNNVARGGTVTQNHSMDRDFVLGAENNGGSTPMDAYLAETYFIQGTVLHPVNDGFIRLNGDGVYVPDTPTISSYGTNGWHLTYDSSQSNGIGHDSSGNGNHFTATGFDTTAISSANRLNDIDIKDTPTSNYATFNPLWHQLTPSLRGANMALNTANTITGQATFRFPVGTTGKYWVEAGTANSSATTNPPALLLTSQLDAAGLSNESWSTTANYSGLGAHINAYYTNFNSTTQNAFTKSTGQVALGINFDDQEVLMYHGGSLINTDTTVDFTKELALNIQQPDTSYNTYQPYINAGQQTHIQSPPSGYVALQTNNLPEPTIKNGKEHFDIYTYTSASTAADITFTGWEFQPDLVWFKCTSHGSSHRLYDSVRGVNKGIQSNTANAEGTDTDALNSFDSNGFSLGTGNSDINYDSRSFVAYGWKAGGTAVSNTNGTITSSVSANTKAGFSIVSWTGTQTASQTVGHGLTQAPDLVIYKARDEAANWIVGSSALDATQYLILDVTNAVASNSTYIPSRPSNTVLNLGSVSSVNNDEKMIAYCWHSVEGYSKIGKYTGNGNTDGTFIYTGFSPAFIMYKKVNGANSWHIIDNKRDTSNPARTNVFADDALAEDTTYIRFDFLSNGFKQRTSYDANNASGGEYIYMAFAEHPFGGENTPPATAR